MKNILECLVALTLVLFLLLFYVDVSVAKDNSALPDLIAEIWNSLFCRWESLHLLLFRDFEI